MTLSQCVSALKHIALAQKNVRSFGEGDLYAFMNADPNIQYDVVYLTQNQHQSENEFTRFSWNIFYISRDQDVPASNSLQIQSIGKEVITNIIRTFCNEYMAEVSGIIYWQSFTQEFGDLASGIYATVNLEVPESIICAE